MNFYEFGKKNASITILLSETYCHWKASFGEVILLLGQDFRDVCVSYDGFNETEQRIFSDMVTETEKIERYKKTTLTTHLLRLRLEN